MGGLFFSVSSVSFQALFISLHLLIITLFQEDNIFGTNASLTYGQMIHIHAFDNNKTMKIIYSMYTAVEISVHPACWLPNPTCLEGKVRFIQAQNQQVLPHVVARC